MTTRHAPRTSDAAPESLCGNHTGFIARAGETTNCPDCRVVINHVREDFVSVNGNNKPMSKKIKIDDGHRMGQRCGYTQMPDGSIRPAPTYADEFRKLSNERHGINDLMKLFSSHCADLLAEISRRQNALWDSISEDYGLDRKTHEIRFDGDLLHVTPIAPKQKEPTTPVSTSGDSNG